MHKFILFKVILMFTLMWAFSVNAHSNSGIPKGHVVCSYKAVYTVGKHNQISKKFEKSCIGNKKIKVVAA
jgi:hypothetical protein